MVLPIVHAFASLATKRMTESDESLTSTCYVNAQNIKNPFTIICDIFQLGKVFKFLQLLNMMIWCNIAQLVTWKFFWSVCDFHNLMKLELLVSSYGIKKLNWFCSTSQEQVIYVFNNSEDSPMTLVHMQKLMNSIEFSTFLQQTHSELIPSRVNGGPKKPIVLIIGSCQGISNIEKILICHSLAITTKVTMKMHVSLFP